MNTKNSVAILGLLISCLCAGAQQPAYMQVVGSTLTLQPGPTNPPSTGSNFLTATVLNVQDFGAVGNDIHDDTAAIQAAINSCVSNYALGGTIFFPPGRYLTTAQLSVPIATNMNTTVSTVRLLGASFPGQGLGDVSTGWGAIAESVIHSTASGGSILYVAFNPVFSGFNSVTLDLENLSFEAPPNPQIRGLNLTNAFSCRIKGVMVWTATAPAGVLTAPTNPNAVGISTPANNNGAFTRLSQISVVGFYTGYEINEHTEIDYCSSWKCFQAATFLFGYHASHFGRFMDVQCPHGLVWNGTHRLVIDEYDVERAPGGWATRMDDCLDAGSVGAANIVWATVQSPTGVSHLFNAIGTNILNHEVGKATWLQGNNVP